MSSQELAWARFAAQWHEDAKGQLADVLQGMAAVGREYGVEAAPPAAPVAAATIRVLGVEHRVSSSLVADPLGHLETQLSFEAVAADGALSPRLEVYLDGSGRMAFSPFSADRPLSIHAPDDLVPLCCRLVNGAVRRVEVTARRRTAGGRRGRAFGLFRAQETRSGPGEPQEPSRKRRSG